MTKKAEITQENFNRLLKWLHEDREIAAERYMSIHRRLIHVFSARGAFPAEELADRVMDIVLQKIDHLIKEYKGEPLPYFHSIAKMVLLEHSRKQFNERFEEGMLQRVSSADDTAKLRENDNAEAYLQCLEDCLDSLPPIHRRLFVKYYQYEGQEKIDYHKKLAKEFKLQITTLRTRVYRIKTGLEKSIEKCVRKKSL